MQELYYNWPTTCLVLRHFVTVSGLTRDIADAACRWAFHTTGCVVDSSSAPRQIAFEYEEHLFQLLNDGSTTVAGRYDVMIEPESERLAISPTMVYGSQGKERQLLNMPFT